MNLRNNKEMVAHFAGERKNYLLGVLGTYPDRKNVGINSKNRKNSVEIDHKISIGIEPKSSTWIDLESSDRKMMNSH